jgi:hypothetical protein
MVLEEREFMPTTRAVVLAVRAAQMVSALMATIVKVGIGVKTGGLFSAIELARIISSHKESQRRVLNPLLPAAAALYLRFGEVIPANAGRERRRRVISKRCQGRQNVPPLFFG